mgnify:CR=1 FL=1
MCYSDLPQSMSPLRFRMCLVCLAVALSQPAFAQNAAAPATETLAPLTRDVNGQTTVRATRVGSETAVHRVAQMVEAAQAGKAPVQRLADRLGLGLLETANGILDIVIANMAKAIRVISVQRGYDPRDYTLVGFGGAGPVQAARLGVKKTVLVNDIEWLGGQFSSEGVGCPDEWTSVNGRRVNFPPAGRANAWRREGRGSRTRVRAHSF